MDDIKIFAKTKRIGHHYTNNDNIQSIYRNGIWNRKMHLASIEKWRTAQDGRS